MNTQTKDSRNRLTIESKGVFHKLLSTRQTRGRFAFNFAMESLLQNLKKHVECSICLDNFTEPKTIACLHTFCCECLKKHALMTQRDGQFRCPECQTQITIPEGNLFDQLPTSFLHNSLLSLLTVQQSGDRGEISCGLCKKKSAEASYCFECEKFLCSHCLDAHELFRGAAFAGHKVTPVKQFQAEDYEALLKRKAFCTQKYHEKEVTRFYCRVCHTCICQICFNMNHKTHEIELLETVADEERAKILAGVESMKQKHQTCRDIIRHFEETAANLEANIATTKRQVSQSAEQMIAVIHEREREAITTLENTCLSRMQKLDAVKKQVQQLERQIKQAAEFATELAQRSSSADIIGNRKNLQERFEELCKTQMPALPAGSFVKFVSSFELDTLSLGIIKSTETDPNKSTIEGLKQTFQAGVEAEISICPKTSEGQISNRQHEDHVEVQVEPSDQLASLIIYEGNDEAGRNFQVKFVPKLPGVYHISAKINGESLSQSPFTVKVQERKLENDSELHLQNGTLEKPAGIAVSSKGLIAIADFEKNCIVICDKEGKIVRQVGSKGENLGQLNSPSDVTFINDDEILVTDEENHRIQQFNVHSAQNFINSFGRKGAEDGNFKNPASVCVHDEGRILVSDLNNHRVQVLTRDGAPMLIFGNNGPGKLNRPVGCVSYKNMFIVADSGNSCLKIFNTSGNFLRKIGERGYANGQFLKPYGVCVDQHGNILVSDRESGYVQRFTIEGRFTGKTVTKLNWPWGMATMPDGRILVCDHSAKKILFLK